MKVHIQQIPKFRVSIGDKIYDDFKEVETWEGLTKFSGPSGVLIVDLKVPFLDLSDVLRTSDAQKGTRVCEAIKATPSLILEAGKRNLKIK